MKALWHKLFPLLLITAGYIAYHNSFSGAFVLDDRGAIVDNELIHRLWPVDRILFGVRPILNLTLALNYALTGLDVRIYHAVNLLVHILAGLTLFGVVRRSLEAERLRARYGGVSSPLAFMIALLWLVHPLQTQSVTYIIQRAEALMGLFYLCVIYCTSRGHGSPQAFSWYAAAILSFALGLGSKEVMVTAPLTLLVYDRIFLASSWKEVLRQRWGLYLGLSTICGLFLASFVSSYSTWAEPTAGFAFKEITPFQYAITQWGVILHYLRLAFWPHPLVLDYYWPVAKGLREALLPGFLISCLLGSTLLALRYRPSLGFLSLWFFLILAPTSSFMPIADVAFEQRMYLPLASVITLAVMGSDYLVEKLLGSSDFRRTVHLGLMGVFAVILGVLTIQRNEVYRSEMGIWLDTAEKRPQNPRPYNSIGLILAHSGKLEEARLYFTKAAQLDPHDPGYHANLANVYREMGRVDEAIREYQDAIQLKPNAFGPYNNLGNVFRDKRDFQQAEFYYRKALALKPDTPQIYNNLGIIFMEQGDLEEALFQYQEALRLKPDFAEGHNNVGLALLKQGKVAEARRHFERALQINPDYRDAKQNLKVTLASQEKTA